jgi:hypothetical protein
VVQADSAVAVEELVVITQRKVLLEQPTRVVVVVHHEMPQVLLAVQE